MMNGILQWIGAAFIITGHILNAIGTSVYPWNIISFVIGTIFFLIWALRIRNLPQIAVNMFAMIIGIIGIFNSFI